ncbi:MAG: DUF4166 domain-containing protein [Hyphomicrobiaceae bacterium]|nr:DUF4166 domain-containing protein [Hyphomicrobiaceae bacterium]
MTNKVDPSRAITFVYDGDCPLCTSAAMALRIKRDYGTLQLLNAREQRDHPVVRDLTGRGFDLDEGMAIIADGHIHHGPDALRFMARYGDARNPFMAATRSLYWSKTLAVITYPWLRGVRNWLLRRRGVDRIDNLALKDQPTFKPIFGEDWEMLPPVLRAHYANRPYTTDEVVVEGVLDVECHGIMRLLAPVLRLMRQIPARTEKSVPVTVRLRSDTDTRAYHFDRTFRFASGPYRFHSRMFPLGGDEVVEVMRFGFGWRMRYFWDGAKVVLQHRGYALRVAGHYVPIPLGLMIGEGYAEEIAVDDEHFDMMTHITHPWWGKIYGYKGRFRLTRRLDGT